MPDADLSQILACSPVRVVFACGALDQLGACVRDEGATRVLLVTDPGIVAAGHAERAINLLGDAGLRVVVFDGVRENPTTEHVAAGLSIAQGGAIDFIVGLGGGSAMDCAKGVNLLLTNGGEVADYWGVNKPSKPMLPMLAVPTTAGTGSEAQSFALISDPVTHRKMACGDRRAPTEGGLRPRLAILDPDLTRSQPPAVAAAAGIDAIAHAVETSATTERCDISRSFSRSAWELLDRSFERAICQSSDNQARADMLLAAHLGGAAIEFSMLGAAHACANPLTACFGIVHGQAVGLMLPHVVRFNAADGNNPYSDLASDAFELADRVESLLESAGLQRKLADLDVPRARLANLATMAAEQWTAQFNPRGVDVDSLCGIYESAY